MKHAILGFLIDQPMHGYELKRALSPALPPERRVNDGVLYPLLKRMEAEGLIRGRVERGTARRDRHVFHPTATGRRAFDAMALESGRRGRRGRLRLPARPSVPDQVPVLRPAATGARSRGSSRTSSSERTRSSRLPGDPRRHGRARGGPVPHRRARPRHRTAEGEGAMAASECRATSSAAHQTRRRHDRQRAA